MEGMLFELCDEVLAHGEQEEAVAEGERIRCTSRDGNSHLIMKIMMMAIVMMMMRMRRRQ